MYPGLRLKRGGSGSGERVVVDKIPGVPDGIRTDEKGNIYVAAKMLYAYSPQGQLLGQLEFPESVKSQFRGCGFFDAVRYGAEQCVSAQAGSKGGCKTDSRLAGRTASAT